MPLGLTENQRRVEEGKRWLRTEPIRNNRVGKSWRAKKVLGRGGQGIVGLWSYEGPDRDHKGLTEVAVKQSVAITPAGKFKAGLSREAQMLEYLRSTGSPHIVKSYRHLYEEPGNNTMPLDAGIVHRLYLEYCPGGDLTDWLHGKLKRYWFSETSIKEEADRHSTAQAQLVKQIYGRFSTLVELPYQKAILVSGSSNWELFQEPTELIPQYVGFRLLRQLPGSLAPYSNLAFMKLSR